MTPTPKPRLSGRQKGAPTGVLSVRVPLELKSRIDALAAAAGISPSRVVAEALKWGIAELTGAPKAGELRTENTAHGLEQRHLIGDEPHMAIALERTHRRVREVLAQPATAPSRKGSK